MVWPDFNELGDLPVGLHRAKIADVIARLVVAQLSRSRHCTVGHL